MSHSRNRPRIVAMGTYLPERVLSNQDLEKIVETTDEWITSRTGIRERRIGEKHETSSTMGTKAALACLENANISPSEIDLILVTTATPDYMICSTAALIQNAIGASHCAAFDLQAACSGFLYGLATAKAFAESGMYKNILLIASEKISAFIDYQDRNTCVLFGDGAAAALITTKGRGLQVDQVCLGADGSACDLITMPAGGSKEPPTVETVEARKHYFRMEGREVFKHAVRRMGAAAELVLEKTGLKHEDISWFVPHQANERIIDFMASQFEIPPDKVFKTVHKYGNTSASSVPIALSELIEEHPLKAGEHVLLVAFGAGLTWGAAILQEVTL